MIYEYLCEACGLGQDILKSMKDSSRQEFCHVCKGQMRRVFTSKVYFNGTKVTSPEYSPAFGKVVNNKRHLDYLKKEHNVEEIGSEKPQTVHKHFDTVRTEKLQRSWEGV